MRTVRRSAKPAKQAPRRGRATKSRAAPAATARAAATRSTAPLRSAAIAREIYAIVRAIPRGRVATYGQIAELAGLPSGHRIVARAMRDCPSGLPWQRVVGKKDARRAQINIQHPDHGKAQRSMLVAEGVVFDAGGFIVLKRSGWLPQ